MTKLRALETAADGVGSYKESTTRTIWMANNAIPDSIITNMVCRNLAPPPEPKVRSTEVTVELTNKNTLRILNTIKPVTRAFTAMDKTRLVIVTGTAHCADAVGLSDPSQVARGDKLKSASSYQTWKEGKWTDLNIRLPRMKEWSRYGYVDPIR